LLAWSQYSHKSCQILSGLAAIIVLVGVVDNAVEGRLRIQLEGMFTMIHGKGTFKGKSWDETPYDEGEALPKLARAEVTNSFAGDIEGESTLQYLLAYQDEESANFVGLERITGRVGGREGSFVLQQNGTYENGIAKGEWFVVPGTGTGGLTGLRGSGGFQADHEGATYSLDFEID
jgi:Protein of unknown function (DUF3224)